MDGKANPKDERPSACPFCGEAEIQAEDRNGKVWCFGCGATAPDLAAWNRRVNGDNESFAHWGRKWKDRVRKEERERCAERCYAAADRDNKTNTREGEMWDEVWEMACEHCGDECRQEEVGGE